MVLGVGVDLVSVARFARFRARRGERGLRRLFTAGELQYCLRLADPVPSLAARFAAKEALYKALGTGSTGTWTDVEVVRAPSGEPWLHLSGIASENARRLGVRRMHLSLAHTRELAIANVLLEG
ncbi:MAG: holo-ACP synthase [Gemmatimonadetes bacterium]|nr:holo-ACP synthase [Gemmatimonadota bacterium]